ncbi:MAG TPA: serine--tRNA ligase [Acidimicrobiia bacterium]|nr:serine--tRNA ligase [Acidimicrobiia bacterium]
MIDPAILRTDPERLAKSLHRRGLDLEVNGLVELEERVRRARQRAEELRAGQKEAGREIARLQGEEKERAIARVAELAEEYRRADSEAAAAQASFDEVWATVPNLVDDNAADGLTDVESLEIKRVGEPPRFEFEPLDFATLGTNLDLIDMERGAKVSGTRFGFLKGQAVLLEFALVRFALERLVGHGHVPVVPPVLVREEALYGTGFFPGDREQVYSIPDDDLFLVGTSEVPLAAYHADEIFEADQLPLRYAGFSTCFRREAGTYGKDTQGLFRVHQFDKVEMFVFTTPAQSPAEHERLLGIEEDLIQALDIPYRVVNVAAGDLGSSAAKKYDIEAWFPSQQTYREITSCSNTTDYQARRLKIRVRGEGGNQIVHTLNGTAIAVGRLILAILENHQQADSSVRIPPALVPHLGFDRLGS